MSNILICKYKNLERVDKKQINDQRDGCGKVFSFLVFLSVGVSYKKDFVFIEYFNHCSTANLRFAPKRFWYMVS